MNTLGGSNLYQAIRRRVRACDYLVVAQLFLQNNFLLDRALKPDDIKPRLLGHWGTCHGIDVAYANLKAFFDPASISARERETDSKTNSDLAKFGTAFNLASSASGKIYTGYANRPEVEETPKVDFSFILGPGHGFPALQANLFIDGVLEEVDKNATRDEQGIAYLCKNFSWPGGFPSHASPLTPGVICEGGELGYALGAAYGYALGHPEKTVAVMLGDGELETATALGSLNLVKTVGDQTFNGRVLPILHLNGYKISAPTLYGRKSERELKELIRGFGYTPFWIEGDAPEVFQKALQDSAKTPHPFFVLKTEKGATGPTEVHGQKVAGNFLAHQIPLPNAKTDADELKILSNWLKSYEFSELFNAEEGFKL